MSLPEVEPVVEVVNRFWKRVAEVTARYHGAENKWVGADELVEWNRTHTASCQKCTNSKSKRQCVIDEDHPSCRTCRTAKVGCDRKSAFIFDMNRDDFFPSYDQFLKKSRLRRFRLMNGGGLPAQQALHSQPKERADKISAIVNDTSASAIGTVTKHPIDYENAALPAEEIRMLKIKDQFHNANYDRYNYVLNKLSESIRNLDRITQLMVFTARTKITVEDVLDYAQQLSSEVDTTFSYTTLDHVRLVPH
ncbi:hypothetical protein B0H13DRAFT_1900895 [Mycena leptocephala]|nr:hypothetical protein B0H13DRAFT_1900895 [Mycena leptocephala]